MKKYLTILQLEGYDIARFLRWLIKGGVFNPTETKIKLVVTAKVKLIAIVTFVIGLLILLYIYKINNNLLLLTFSTIFLFLNTYILIILSTLVLKPLDYFFRIYEILTIKKRLSSCRELKVIGVTGSYGKTSTKEILYQLIKDKFKTLRTPESFNTIAGIKKSLHYELDNSYELLICELSAYQKGDIKRLCGILNPTYGILTGITTQHLERFGSLPNIIKTKFELYDYITNKKNVILNINSINVVSEIANRHLENMSEYLKATDISFSKSGSKFEIKYKNKSYKVSTKLFGFSNIENIMGALTMALKLGIDIDYLINRISNLTPIQSRFVIKDSGNSIIVDNTFSSNEQSFKETIRVAEAVKGKKVLVTPGLVELGKDEGLINDRIGVLADRIFDKIVLVGNNSRTTSFSKNFKSSPEFITDTRKDYFDCIEILKQKYDWIFLENDVTQNYN